MHSVRFLLGLVVLLGVVHPSASCAQPQSLDATPKPGHPGVAVAAELATIGSSVVLGLHNARATRQGERSIGWSLAGIAVGVAALSAGASNDAEVPAFGVVAGLGSVLAGVARLALHGEAVQAQSVGQVELDTGPRHLGLRLRF